MANTETHHRGTENPLLPNLTLSEFAALGKKSMEEFAKAQSDMLSAMQDAHRHWLDRMQSEAKLASEFTRSVASCRSIPEAVAVCQEWTGRRLEMMADDSKHLVTDSRRMMERSARFLSDGLFFERRSETSTEAEAARGAGRVREKMRSGDRSDSQEAAT